MQTRFKSLLLLLLPLLLLHLLPLPLFQCVDVVT
jgi:hypothetical protein